MRLALAAIAPLLALAGVLVAVRYLWSVLVAPSKAFRIALMVDEATNAALNGAPDETISHRAADARRRGQRWGCVLCGVLDRINPGHCDRA